MSDGRSCCTPARTVPAGARRSSGATRHSDLPGERISIPGGAAFAGTARPHLEIDGEAVIRRGKLRAFSIDSCVVTNARFAEFTDATGYQTDAERLGDSFVFAGLLPGDDPGTAAASGTSWWRMIPGATWAAPTGPGSKFQPDHPVVQVSWNDAQAFADWAGGRLPTEMEWEHAARAGQGDVAFPWASQAEPDDAGNQPCNIWQGSFPQQNLALDGYSGTAPAQSFEPNPWGLYNMVGNTWEWTADRFTPRSLSKRIRAFHAHRTGFRTLKGGSFLCHRSYCYRYRIAARSGSSPESATNHQGFRLVYDLPGGR